MSGAVEIGPYRLGELVARGTRCRLDAAVDRRFDRAVLLKRAVDRKDGPALALRLGRQALLSGPHVVTVHDVVADSDGGVVGVLERVRARDLRRIHEERGPFEDPTELVDLARQILFALEEIHAAGGAHGRVEPEHVLLTRLDGRSFVRLTAFGSAPAADPAADLESVGRLLSDLAGPEGLPLELAETFFALDLPDARSLRQALRPGEISSWTRILPPPPEASIPSSVPEGDGGTVVALLAGGRRLLDESAWELAADLAREVLARSPGHPEGLTLLAQAEASDGARETSRHGRSADAGPETSGGPEEGNDVPGDESTVAPSGTGAALRQGAGSEAGGAIAEPDQELASSTDAASPPDPLRTSLESALQAGDAQAAGRALEKLVERSEDGEDLGLWRLRVCGQWVREAEKLLAGGDVEAARAALGEGQVLAPGSTEVQRVSEEVEDARDRRRSAERLQARREALAEICHLVDGDRLREAWELYQVALHRLGAWPELEALGKELAEHLVAEAQWNAARDRIEDAADLLRRATLADPLNPHARSLLAATEAAVGAHRQQRRSEELLRQAVRSIETMMAREDLDGASAALEFARTRFQDDRDLEELAERLRAVREQRPDSDGSATGVVP